MKSPMLSRAMVLTLSSVVLSAVYAGSATWNLNATSGEWNTAANWTRASLPEGASRVAAFGLSNQTSVVLNANVELDQMVFDAGASSRSSGGSRRAS